MADIKRVFKKCFVSVHYLVTLGEIYVIKFKLLKPRLRFLFDWKAWVTLVLLNRTAGLQWV